MTLSLALQHTYQSVEIALFKNDLCIATEDIDKKEASKKIVVAIQKILSDHNYVLNNCTYIAVNQGPGPFTTLRVVIATVNGISFASTIPLVGVDGLDAVLQEYNSDDCSYTVALLNAFNKDVYFGIYQQGVGVVAKGYRNIEQLLQELVVQYPDTKLYFVGNGVTMHQELIRNIVGAFAFIPHEISDYCSVQQIGKMGYKQWEKQENVSRQLLPIYIKDAAALYVK